MEWWSHCRKSRSALGVITVKTPLPVFLVKNISFPHVSTSPRGDGGICQGLWPWSWCHFLLWESGPCCKATSCKVPLVHHLGTWKRAKRFFGHGVPKPHVGALRYKAEDPNRQGQAAWSRQRNQGDLFRWNWAAAWLRTSESKKANHHGERKSEVPHSLREKLYPERWTFSKNSGGVEVCLFIFHNLPYVKDNCA